MKYKKNDILKYTGKYADICRETGYIDPVLYDEYGVKRGLRDKNGNGVLAGLTSISKIKAFEDTPDGRIPCPGELYYRGINVVDLIKGRNGNRFGFEEASYLVLFGKLPTEDELKEFISILSSLRTLPTNFTRDVIMKAPSKDIMNSLTKSVLTLAAYDSNASDISLDNVLRQCLSLISLFPMLSVYAYHAYNHYLCNDSLYIHRPDPKLSTAENILRMLRPDKSYTPLEALVLDTALILHMEHGGGNNSSFTTHVVTSSGSDTYSVMAAALCSLKGPKHGGANIKVVRMMEDLKKNVRDTSDEDEVRAYLNRLLNKEEFDKKGLIYTPLEALVLDTALILHMEHGGGNNSSFTTHVVTSSGSDTYSVMAAALCSLKGPKHGGANIKVVRMMEDLKKNVRDTSDEDEVRAYLNRLLNKEEFDKKGLIYGMGHAVYSVSDPRAEVFKSFTKELADEKGRSGDFALYNTVERLGKEIISEKRKIYKGVSVNVDFYSGFVYSMLDIPVELFTPIFAIARITGWSAHRIEELINTDKIIRPAYKSVSKDNIYLPLSDR